MSIETFQPVRFSHIEAFRTALRGVCGSYSVTPRAADGRLRACAGLFHHGGLEFARVGLDAPLARRDRLSIKRDDIDHFVLVLGIQGQAQMAQAGCSARLRRGDLLLLDSSQPSTFDFSTGYCEQLSVHIPRDQIQARFGGQARGGLLFRREHDLAGIVQTLLRRLSQGGLEAAGAKVLADALLNIMGVCLAEVSGTSSSQGEDLLARSLRLIDRSYADPEFGPRLLAEQLNIPLRRLQRLFADIGSTPRAHIQQVRLEQSRLALARRGERSVSDIAFAHGFNDLSYFYRAFRERFGIPPGASV
ncbi:helix-turn-helix domain-containing protein [Acidocella sp.]|uniref:helix-turn-helix domain-containing protein n=1 Tax=Acidocella sp. TaxID=50710 RepID=UPI003D01E74D